MEKMCLYLEKAKLVETHTLRVEEDKISIMWKFFSETFGMITLDTIFSPEKKICYTSDQKVTISKLGEGLWRMIDVDQRLHIDIVKQH